MQWRVANLADDCNSIAGEGSPRLDSRRCKVLAEDNSARMLPSSGTGAESELMRSGGEGMPECCLRICHDCRRCLACRQAHLLNCPTLPSAYAARAGRHGGAGHLHKLQCNGKDTEAAGKGAMRQGPWTKVSARGKLRTYLACYGVASRGHTHGTMVRPLYTTHPVV